MKITKKQYDSIKAKCQSSGSNTYDTKKYRYCFLATGELARCDIAIIGTTAGLDPNEWETVGADA
jgi:hypothetical protein